MSTTVRIATVGHANRAGSLVRGNDTLVGGQQRGPAR